MRPKVGTPSTSLGRARDYTGQVSRRETPEVSQQNIYRCRQWNLSLSRATRYILCRSRELLLTLHTPFNHMVFVVTCRHLCRHLSSPVSSPVVTCRHLSSPDSARSSGSTARPSRSSTAHRASPRVLTRPPSPTDSSSQSGLGRPHQKGVAFEIALPAGVSRVAG